MKNNIEAKFYKEVFEASKLENKDLERIIFKIDNEIDNPSNTNVIDCSNFYKETTKSKKSKKTPELYSVSED
jgi:hypothetical protein